MIGFGYKSNLLKKFTFRSLIPNFSRVTKESIQARNPTKILAGKRMDLSLPNQQNYMHYLLWSIKEKHNDRAPSIYFLLLTTIPLDRLNREVFVKTKFKLHLCIQRLNQIFDCNAYQISDNPHSFNPATKLFAK